MWVVATSPLMLAVVQVRAQRLPTAQRFGNEASGVAPTASKAKLKQQPSGCTVTADTDAADAAAVTGFNATLFGISGDLDQLQVILLCA